MADRITVEQAIREGWYRPNTNDGYCHCGCGGKAPIASMTKRTQGAVKGQPRRYIFGHGNKMRSLERITVEQATQEGWYLPNTNDGYCHCGCGERAPLSDTTTREYGYVRGQPRRYVRGHGSPTTVPCVAARMDICIDCQQHPSHVRNLCHSCYRRWLRGSRSTSNPPPNQVRPCPIDGCTNNYNAAYGKGCCYDCSKARGPGRVKRSLDERIEYHIFMPNGQNGCWLWNGLSSAGNHAGKRGGLPIVHYYGECINVRRFLYIEEYGDLPTGGVCYACDKYVNCVNPRHTIVGPRNPPHLTRGKTLERFIMKKHETKEVKAFDLPPRDLAADTDGLPVCDSWGLWPGDFTAQVDAYAEKHNITLAETYRRISAITGNSVKGLSLRYYAGKTR